MRTHQLLLFALVNGLGISTLACGSNTLQPIDPGEGGGGNGGINSGGSGTGTTLDAPVDPTFVLVNEDGLRHCIELDELELVTTCSDLPDLVDEEPWAAAQLADDLIIGTSETVGEARMWRVSGFFGAGSTMATAGELMTLSPVSSSAQILHSVRGGDEGALWVLTAGITDFGFPSNTLRVSIDGDLNGPWVVHESEPAIVSWVQLDDPDQLVISTGSNLQRLVLDRAAGTFTEAPGYGHRYTAIAHHDGAFYGVTDVCVDGPECSNTGELHIWQDVSDPSRIATVPDIIAQLPETNSVACRLAVGDRAVVVATCASGAASPEPMLHVLTEQAAPQSFALDEEPLEIDAIHWADDDFFGRTISVFVRSLSVVRIFEDPDGSALSHVHTVGSPKVPPGNTRDMLIGD